MAILKSINLKNNGRKKFLDSVSYISNPQKIYGSGKDERDFIESTWVNRFLNGKKDCKRHVMHYILSMKECWPSADLNRQEYENKLDYVLQDCKKFFMEQGFFVIGYIECNTQHPHYHLVLETCNAFNGKQFSQSKSDLASFKEFVNKSLNIHGFDENILSVEKMTEDEMDKEDTEVFQKRKKTEQKGWNNGTMEQISIMDIPFSDFNLQQGREMVYVVSEEKRIKGREMVCVVSEERRIKGREMVRIVSGLGERKEM